MRTDDLDRPFVRPWVWHPKEDPMTDQTTPDPADPTNGKTTTDGIAGNASQIIETIKEAIDEFAERAAPTVREVSARVAEVTSAAAAKAAPLAKKAGEATAEGAEKLAEKSKGWAADVRQTIANAADNVEDAIKGDDDAPPAAATKPVDDETPSA
jgi:hypothetical protein